MVVVALAALLVNEFRPVGREEAVRVAKDHLRARHPEFPVDRCLVDAWFGNTSKEVRGRWIDKADCWTVTFSRTPEMADFDVTVKSRRDVEIWFPHEP